MTRLKSRQHQVPNGFKFRQPEIKWDSTKVLPMHPSFETLVSAVISARNANPHQKTTNKWSVERSVVADEVEAYNVKVCQSMGWTAYLAESGGGASVPFLPPNAQEQRQMLAAAAKSKKIWSGIKTISEWIETNAPAVEKEKAEARAETCVKCPYNGQGDFTQWFVTPAAATIRRQLEKAQQRNLSTSQDEKLGICAQKKEEGNGGCLCALKLSVHIPIKLKLAYMSDEVKRGLHPSCWMLKEEKELQSKAA